MHCSPVDKINSKQIEMFSTPRCNFLLVSIRLDLMIITFSGFLGSSWEMYLNKCAGSTSISILSITVRLSCLSGRCDWLAGRAVS